MVLIPRITIRESKYRKTDDTKKKVLAKRFIIENCFKNYELCNTRIKD